jgi:Flp pilus assembly pilin Flp
MRRHGKKGQSAVEYTLVLAAVIAVLVALVANNGRLRTSINNAYTRAGDAMDNTAQDITNNAFQP